MVGGTESNGSSEEAAGSQPLSSGNFAQPLTNQHTDDRKKWDWKSRFPQDARQAIRVEGSILIAAFLILLLATGFSLGVAPFQVVVSLGWLTDLPQEKSAATPMIVPTLGINFHVLSIFFAGSIGGVSFSIKWLVHATAKGWWHVDRRCWRLLTPFLGGVYACVVLTFLDAGMLSGAPTDGASRSPALAAALAFLVGYFSDGVSGLLSNVANAVFGTLDKK